jgi:hypothetical protein
LAIRSSILSSLKSFARKLHCQIEASFAERLEYFIAGAGFVNPDVALVKNTKEKAANNMMLARTLPFVLIFIPLLFVHMILYVKRISLIYQFFLNSTNFGKSDLYSESDLFELQVVAALYNS